MRFVYPYVLLLELLIPALAVFFAHVSAKRRRAIAAFGDPGLVTRLSTASRRSRQARAVLLLAALFFLVLALARPQFGTRLVEVTRRGADVIIAVDVSRSMLAEDIKPSRLAAAKSLLGRLARELEGNRVGVVAFAGTAFWQCPLTLDTSAVNLFLQIMDANLIPLPGTAIGEAVRLAAKGLGKTATKTKAVILLTDGEDHRSDPEGVAREAAKEGVRVFTIGFGNPAGEPIPEYDAQGQLTGYKKNTRGEVVMSKLDETLLMKLAEETGGRYFPAPNGAVDLNGLLAEIAGLDRQRLTDSLNRQYEDRYQIFLFLALLCLLAEPLVPRARGVAQEFGGSVIK